jgi:hypothetical protein
VCNHSSDWMRVWGMSWGVQRLDFSAGMDLTGKTENYS